MTTDYDPGDRTTDRARWLALYVLCGSMLMIVLDATIVNVALPSIKSELGLRLLEPRVGGQRVPDRIRRAACCSPAGSATWPVGGGSS